MAGFEDVIQRALEKQDSGSVLVRQQIYDSARKTLAKMLNSAGNLSPENIRDQQQRLEIAIAEIESRYITPDTVYPEVNPVMVEPPPVQGPAGYNDAAQSEKRSIFKRRPFAILLLSTTIIVAAAMGTWWIYDQDLARPAAMRDNSVPNPPRILKAESSAPDGSELVDGEWLTIFEPGDPRELSTQAASTAELGEDGAGKYVRLAAQGGVTSNSAIVTVEPGLMEAMHGKTATFELKTKSGDGADLQFVITCQFNSSGDCGRKRFTTGKLAESFVFNVKIIRGNAEDENKSGSISIVADISGQGRPLDLYLLRISVK